MSNRQYVAQELNEVEAGSTHTFEGNASQIESNDFRNQCENSKDLILCYSVSPNFIQYIYEEKGSSDWENSRGATQQVHRSCTLM